MKIRIAKKIMSSDRRRYRGSTNRRATKVFVRMISKLFGCSLIGHNFSYQQHLGAKAK